MADDKKIEIDAIINMKFKTQKEREAYYAPIIEEQKEALSNLNTELGQLQEKMNQFSQEGDIASARTLENLKEIKRVQEEIAEGEFKLKQLRAGRYNQPMPTRPTSTSVVVPKVVHPQTVFRTDGPQQGSGRLGNNTNVQIVTSRSSDGPSFFITDEKRAQQELAESTRIEEEAKKYWEAMKKLRTFKGYSMPKKIKTAYENTDIDVVDYTRMVQQELQTKDLFNQQAKLNKNGTYSYSKKSLTTKFNNLLFQLKAEKGTEELTKGDISAIFESIYNENAAKIEALRQEVTHQGNGYSLKTSGFGTFIKNGKIIPAIKKDMEGNITPASTVKIYDNNTSLLSIPKNVGSVKDSYGKEISTLSGMSLSSISEILQNIDNEITPIEREARKRGEEIPERVIELRNFIGIVTEFFNDIVKEAQNAFDLGKANFAQVSLLRQFNSQDYDTGEYYGTSYLHQAIRTRNQHTDQYSDIHDRDGYTILDKEQEREKQHQQEETKRVRTNLTGSEVVIEDAEIQNVVNSILSPEFLEAIKDTLINEGVKQTRELIKETLGVLGDALGFGDKQIGSIGLDLNGSRLFEGLSETDRGNRLEEANKKKDKQSENTSLYFSVLDKLLQSLNENVEQEENEELKQKLEALKETIQGKIDRHNARQGAIVEGVNDVNTIANSLSNFATVGEVTLNSSNRYAEASGISKEKAFKRAISPLGEDKQLKINESLEAKKVLDVFLQKFSDDFKNKLNNISDENGELDSIKETIKKGNVFEYIYGLKEEADIYAKQIENFNKLSDEEKDKSGLQEIIKTKQSFVELVNGFLENTKKGLQDTGDSVNSEQYSKILKSVNTFSTDLLMFSEFMNKFYKETYSKGATSFNYEDGNFDNTGTFYFLDRSDRSLDRSEVTPKENFLGHTKGLDVLVPYGLDNTEWDKGLIAAQERLKNLKQEREKALAEKEKTKTEYEKIKQEEAEADNVIEEIVKKYVSHVDKNGNVRIDWKESALYDTGITTEEMSNDRKRYEKAKKAKRGLKTSQISDIKKAASVPDDINLKEISVVESDIEYIKRRIEQLEEREQLRKASKTETQEGNNQQSLGFKEQSEIIQNNQNKEVIQTNSIQDQETQEIEGAQEIIASQEEEKEAIEETNQALDEHVDKIEDAVEAEKNKFLISKQLVEQLLKESESINASTESFQNHTDEIELSNQEVNNHKIKAQDDIKLERFDVDYYEDKENGIHRYLNEKGETIVSSTQLRDILLKKFNPTFGIDISRLKGMAENRTSDNPLTAIEAGMEDKDYKFYTETIIGAGKRGDLFHSLIDKMVKNGAKTLEELKNKDKDAFEQYQQDYQKTVEELAKYGIGEEFLGIQGRLESYMDAMGKSGLTATEFSEQHLGLRLNGPRGSIDIGVTPDQLYGGSGFGAFIDNKTGAVRGLEAFQLTAQQLATIANYDNPRFSNRFGDVTEDDLQNAKGYIADVEDGVTTIKEYLMLTLEEFYNLAKDAEDIVNGKREPLSDQEVRDRMGRQLHTGRITGYRNSYYDSNGNFIGPPDNNESNNGNRNSAQQDLNEYINTYEKLLKVKEDIYEIDAKIDEAREKGNEQEAQDLELVKERREIEQEALQQHLRGIEQYNRGSVIIDSNGVVTIQGANDTYNGNVLSQDIQRRAYYRLEAADRRYETNLRNIDYNSNRRSARFDNNAQTKAMREQMAILTRMNTLDLSIANTQREMQNQTGAQRRDSEAVLQTLNRQRQLLSRRLLDYNQETGMLGDIQLSEEHRLDLNRQITEEQARQDTRLRQINTEYQRQTGLIDQIFGGFRNAFAHIFDANMVYQILNYVKQGINQVIQSTKELDASLSDIQIATGQTREETRELLISYTDLGKELGRTTQSIAQASNDWLRAGYEGKEAAELTKASMMLSTLGMINASEATTYLISTLKGWKMEASEVINVVDALTAVDMSAAVSSGCKFKKPQYIVIYSFMYVYLYI